MFDIQVRFFVGKRAVALDGFVDSVIAEISRRVRVEGQSFMQTRPLPPGFPLHVHADERMQPKRLAVGVDEAAKLLGVSPYTIRNYIAARRLRSIRVGWRVLVPMEVLERVMEEGVQNGAR